MAGKQQAAWRLAELAEHRSILERATGVTEEQAADLSGAAAALLDRGLGGTAEAAALLVPGRIEVLGKHTDYAGGRSLTVATEQGFRLVSVAADGPLTSITDLGRGVSAELEIATDLDPAVEGWPRYPRAVSRRLARDFGGSLRGAEIAFSSDLPAAVGLSSSSALVVAIYLALARFNRLEELPAYRLEIGDLPALAGYLGAVENGRAFGSLADGIGVGTRGGSEDHTAILCSHPDRVGQYSYDPVRPERSVPLPAGHLFVIATSGVRAEKAGAARDPYNQASGLATEAARIWRQGTGRDDPNLAAALASSSDAAERLFELLVESASDYPARLLRKRVEHFRSESERIVPAAGDALVVGDLSVFGLLADRSQDLAHRLLDNQIRETIFLAETARELGASSSSAFGAGFGGAVWALVEADEAAAFAEEWLGVYLEEFPRHQGVASALTTTAAAPAREIVPD